MPTVLEINGYKFKFFSNENDERAHVHITKGENLQILKKAWDEYFA